MEPQTQYVPTQRLTTLEETNSSVYLQRFSVPFEYPVFFTSDVLNASNPTLAKAIAKTEPDRRHRVFVVIDSGVAEAWPSLESQLSFYVNAYHSAIELAAQPEILIGGEYCKIDPSLPALLQTRFHELAMDRHSFVVTIGGGSTQDAVGYATATFHRGLRTIRLPTTVLSQADGGVGVKNGINAFGTKNLLGTFSPPFAVINDIRFIDTLELRDRIAGVAEAVKVSLIRDNAFFEWLRYHAGQLARGDISAMTSMIRWCAELHLTHIASSHDPFESGAARPLDFGHWAAHKLEALTNYQLRHGEAVAIGMAIDCRYSVEVGLLDDESCVVICHLLEQLGLPLWDDKLDLIDIDGYPEVIQGLSEFRDHLGGDLTITLLERIGHGIEVQDIDLGAMLRAIGWLKTRKPIR